MDVHERTARSVSVVVPSQTPVGTSWGRKSHRHRVLPAPKALSPTLGLCPLVWRQLETVVWCQEVKRCLHQEFVTSASVTPCHSCDKGPCAGDSHHHIPASRMQPDPLARAGNAAGAVEPVITLRERRGLGTVVGDGGEVGESWDTTPPPPPATSLPPHPPPPGNGDSRDSPTINCAAARGCHG